MFDFHVAASFCSAGCSAFVKKNKKTTTWQIELIAYALGFFFPVNFMSNVLFFIMVKKNICCGQRAHFWRRLTCSHSRPVEGERLQAGLVTTNQSNRRRRERGRYSGVISLFIHWYRGLRLFIGELGVLVWRRDTTLYVCDVKLTLWCLLKKKIN